MKLWLLAAVLTSLALGASDMHDFGINGKPALCVPTRDLDPALLSFADESTQLDVGHGLTPGFAFLVAPAVMKSALRGWNVERVFAGHPYANALSGVVSLVSPDDANRFGSAMRARDTSDEWSSRGRCPKPEVKKLSGTKLYEVSCEKDAKYASIWDRVPSAGSGMPNPNDFVVAACDYQSSQIGPYAGKTFENCSRVVIDGMFMLDYRFQETNAHLIPEMDTFLKSKLKHWEQSCKDGSQQR